MAAPARGRGFGHTFLSMRHCLMAKPERNAHFALASSFRRCRKHWRLRQTLCIFTRGLFGIVGCLFRGSGMFKVSRAFFADRLLATASARVVTRDTACMLLRFRKPFAQSQVARCAVVTPGLKQNFLPLTLNPKPLHPISCAVLTSPKPRSRPRHNNTK